MVLALYDVSWVGVYQMALPKVGGRDGWGGGFYQIAREVEAGVEPPLGWGFEQILTNDF